MEMLIENPWILRGTLYFSFNQNLIFWPSQNLLNLSYPFQCLDLLRTAYFIIGSSLVVLKHLKSAMIFTVKLFFQH